MSAENKKPDWGNFETYKPDDSIPTPAWLDRVLAFGFYLVLWLIVFAVCGFVAVMWGARREVFETDEGLRNTFIIGGLIGSSLGSWHFLRRKH